MENYYKYLGIETSASQDEIKNALENESHQDQEKISKIKAILLNEKFKKAYDEKLISFMLRDSNKANIGDILSNAITSLKEKVEKINSDELHNNFIYLSILLSSLTAITPLLFSQVTSLTLQVFFLATLLYLLYLDWKMLKKSNIANFSKWWILITPIYLLKRSATVIGEKKHFIIWLALILSIFLLDLVYSGSRSSLEKAACELVTDIYSKQLHSSSTKCKSLHILETSGKIHYGIAEMSNGKSIDVSITERSDGMIYVEVY